MYREITSSRWPWLRLSEASLSIDMLNGRSSNLRCARLHQKVSRRKELCHVFYRTIQQALHQVAYTISSIPPTSIAHLTSDSATTKQKVRSNGNEIPHSP